jgi:hypothetical protein
MGEGRETPATDEHHHSFASMVTRRDRGMGTPAATFKGNL